MATPKKLPSGKWRVRVFDYIDEKKKPHYRSITCDTKKECNLRAAEFDMNKKRIAAGDLTVEEALKDYINVKSMVLSQSTIRGYKNMQKNYFKRLGLYKLRVLDNKTVQEWVNKLSEKLSPKTVHNIHGLLMAVMLMYTPDIRLSVVLPRKEKKDLYVPSDTDIKNLLANISDPELYLAVLLAAFGPLRRGEICALNYSDVSGNMVSVTKSMVKDSDGKWHIRPPKTDSSYRTIDFPDFVIKAIPSGSEGRIITTTPDCITSRFGRQLKKLDIPHFRFHDLRHYSASIMHAIGIPDQYIMQRGGWATDGVMKSVYRDTIDEQTAIMTVKINDHFTSVPA